jgi:hypothetical protein
MSTRRVVFTYLVLIAAAALLIVYIIQKPLKSTQADVNQWRIDSLERARLNDGFEDDSQTRAVREFEANQADKYGN